MQLMFACFYFDRLVKLYYALGVMYKINCNVEEHGSLRHMFYFEESIERANHVLPYSARGTGSFKQR